MNKNKLTIEPPKTQSKCTKKAPEGANFKNGGVEDARFELFKKYCEHLNYTPVALNFQPCHQVCLMFQNLAEPEVY